MYINLNLYYQSHCFLRHRAFSKYKDNTSIDREVGKYLRALAQMLISNSTSLVLVTADFTSYRRCCWVKAIVYWIVFYLIVHLWLVPHRA